MGEGWYRTGLVSARKQIGNTLKEGGYPVPWSILHGHFLIHLETGNVFLVTGEFKHMGLFCGN